ncbi:MAG: hypothetical protein ACOYM3_15645 [Terrimicrobiaceae bacterium]
MNPLTRPPFNRTAFTVSVCPAQQKARHAALGAKHSSLVKQLAFVEAQIHALWSQMTNNQ